MTGQVRTRGGPSCHPALGVPSWSSRSRLVKPGEPCRPFETEWLNIRNPAGEAANGSMKGGRLQSGTDVSAHEGEEPAGIECGCCCSDSVRIEEMAQVRFPEGVLRCLASQWSDLLRVPCTKVYCGLYPTPSCSISTLSVLTWVSESCCSVRTAIFSASPAYGDGWRSPRTAGHGQALIFLAWTPVAVESSFPGLRYDEVARPKIWLTTWLMFLGRRPHLGQSIVRRGASSFHCSFILFCFLLLLFFFFSPWTDENTNPSPVSPSNDAHVRILCILQVKRALPPDVLARYEQRQAQDAVTQANIHGLVSLATLAPSLVCSKKKNLCHRLKRHRHQLHRCSFVWGLLLNTAMVMHRCIVHSAGRRTK